MAINDRHLKFIRAYVAHGNVSKAMVDAGYSKNGAGQTGHVLLKKPEIQKQLAIELNKQEAQKRLDALANGLTREQWVKALARIATANMHDFASITKAVHKNGRSGEEVEIKNVDFKATEDIPRELGHVIKKISQTKHGISLELYSAQDAINTLGKHYGYIKEKADGTLEENISVVLTLPSNGSEAETELPIETEDREEKAD